ncbi:MAG: sugar phosphate isomerase/epimerase family protein [Chloroflexota bacterium]
MVKVGCNTLMYGGTDLETALRHIAWAGYDGFELSAIVGVAEHAELGRGREYARALRRQVEAHGLEIWHLGIHPILVEPAGQERLRLGLELASDLEVPLVLTAAMDYPQTADGFAAACGTLGRLAARARELGLRLGVKPHVGTPVYNTPSALAMIETVGAPNLGLDFDVSHIYRADEEPAESFRRLAPHIFTVRVRDAASRAIAIGPPEIQVPGHGQMDLRGALRAMKESGYEGDVSVDIVGTFDYPPERTMAIIAETRGWLRCALGELDWE